MADYHIRVQGLQEKSAQIVFHIPIPGTGTNEANIQWRAVVVMGLGGIGNIESMLYDIDAAELVKLESGELYEYSERVVFSRKGLSAAAKKVEIEARFTALATEILNNRQVVLEWMGYEGTVS